MPDAIDAYDYAMFCAGWKALTRAAAWVRLPEPPSLEEFIAMREKERPTL